MLGGRVGQKGSLMFRTAGVICSAAGGIPMRASPGSLGFIISMVLAGLILIGIARAEITDLKPFSLLCAEEESTGFNWENHRWVRTNFKPDTYILSRLQPESLPCFSLPEPSQSIKRQGDHGYSKSCYVLKRVGEEKGFGEVCGEYWIEKDGELVLRSISCDETAHYKAHIDGPFAIARTFGAFYEDKETGERDSVIVSIGKCSLINTH